MKDSRETAETVNFKQITYTGAKEINYLDDMVAMGPQYVSFLESHNHNLATKNKQTSSYFDNTIDELYKKIVKQGGYVDKPSKVSRKMKKGQSNINYYNASDQFIDDQECCIEKKDKSSSFEDYASFSVSSIEQLYASPLYLKKLDDLIVQVGKRRAVEQFTLNEDHEIQKFDSIKKNIASKILSRTKNIGSDDNQNVQKKDESPQQVQEQIQQQKLKVQQLPKNEQVPQMQKSEEEDPQPQVIVTPPPQTKYEDK